jgi:hypothetical protein
MKSNLVYDTSYLWDPTVFSPSFNQNTESLTANRAWSLFFTIGQEDKVLGFNPEAGKFLTNLLIAVSVTGVLWAAIFNHVA